jgi:hypothetical protein
MAVRRMHSPTLKDRLFCHGAKREVGGRGIIIGLPYSLLAYAEQPATGLRPFIHSESRLMRVQSRRRSLKPAGSPSNSRQSDEVVEREFRTSREAGFSRATARKIPWLANRACENSASHLPP